MSAFTKKINTLNIIKFTLPTIFMMIFMSLYTIIDGMFVSHYVSSDALSAVNIVYPFINVVIGLAVMIGTGGSALMGKLLGQNKQVEARETFSLLVVIGIILGLGLGILVNKNIEIIIHLLGSTKQLDQYCIDYLSIQMRFAPLFVLQLMFQYFFVTAGKPGIGLFITFVGGVTNVVLDYYFIVICNLGISGAAYATACGYSIPAIFGLFYFMFVRNGYLYFVRFKFHIHTLLQVCGNGCSEMVINLSLAVSTFLFNYQMMKYVGTSGVAAITIILYAQFLLNAVFLGFSNGIAPIYSYNYGSQNFSQIKALFKISRNVIAVFSVFIFIGANLVSPLICYLFASKDPVVYDLALEGMKLFSYGFIIVGFNIFTTSLFTAMNNGKVSAILSFFRTFFFITICLFVLPIVLEVPGIFLAVPVGELLSLFISMYNLYKYKNIYHFF